MPSCSPGFSPRVVPAWRLRPTALLLLASAHVACDAPSPRPAAPSSAFVAGPDSGQLIDTESRSRWRSVVRDGRLHEIHERVALFGELRAHRVFEFDTAGMLRRVTERVVRGSIADLTALVDSTDDSTLVTEPARDSIVLVTMRDSTVVMPKIRPRVRETVVDFIRDGPAYASRSYDGAAMHVSRRELRRLHARGYALRDSATRDATIGRNRNDESRRPVTHGRP